MREPNAFAQRDSVQEPDTVSDQESEPLAGHQPDSVSGGKPMSGYEPNSLTFTLTVARRELDSVADRVPLARELPK